MMRKKIHARTIAITGSIGKTTTTELIYAAISSKYRAHKNDGTSNNIRMAAHTLQTIKKTDTYYVQETME